MNAIRDQSLTVLARIGLDVPRSLPLTGEKEPRDKIEILDRICCLHASTACAFGLDHSAALRWVVQEGLGASLSEIESNYLRTGAGKLTAFQSQPESTWALCWAVSLEEPLDFWTRCPGDFVQRLPDITACVSSAEIRDRATLRKPLELAQGNDIGFCLHWVIRNSQSKELPLHPLIDPTLIEARRKALEWVLGRDLWDQITLDT